MDGLNDMGVQCEICGEEFANTQGLAGHQRMKHGEVNPSKSESPKAVVTRAQPLDAVIENLRLPQVPEQYNGHYNIYVTGFNDGVMHGARSILAGIRAAQELSSMGVQQAVPLIKMAQEMRQAEGQAAQILASELGQVTMQSNQQILAALNNLATSQGKPAEPDPWQAMAARMAEPIFLQAMQTLSGSLFKAMPQPGMGQQPATAQQPATQPEQSEPAQAGLGDVFGSLPENITTHSLDELELEEE